MDRRQFAGAGLLTALFGGLTCAGGCGESRQTGTVVETPDEDKASMEASAAAYRAQAKQKTRPAR